MFLQQKCERWRMFWGFARYIILYKCVSVIGPLRHQQAWRLWLARLWTRNLRSADRNLKHQRTRFGSRKVSGSHEHVEGFRVEDQSLSRPRSHEAGGHSLYWDLRIIWDNNSLPISHEFWMQPPYLDETMIEYCESAAPITIRLCLQQQSECQQNRIWFTRRCLAGRLASRTAFSSWILGTKY